MVSESLGECKFAESIKYADKAIKSTLATFAEILLLLVYALTIGDNDIVAMQLFQRLGVQMLPFAFVLQPNTAADQERIRIKEADRLKPDTMETFPWTVTEFDAFLVERTGISIGKVRFLSCTHRLACILDT